MKKKTYQTPELSIHEIVLTTAICSGGSGSGLPPRHTDNPGTWESPGRRLYV